MSRKDRFLCLAVCAVFGLAGGLLSNIAFLRAGNAQVQQTSIIRARGFEVVNDKGTTVAVLEPNNYGSGQLDIYSSSGPQPSNARSHLEANGLTFRDLHGKFRLKVGFDADAPVLYITDKNGEIIWQAK
jgi:hypothetical protein